MYDWIDRTWNPVRGNCGYDCSYCYAKRWGVQKPIHLDEKVLWEDLEKGNFIFVCSGCDLFHPDVPREWIEAVIEYTRKYPENTYLWHTKNPRRVFEFPYLYFVGEPCSVLCTTIESNIPLPGISKAPQPFERIQYLREFKHRKMITVEPVMEFNPITFSEMILSCEPEQVNIGADSGKNHLPEPTWESLKELIDYLSPHTKIHLKKNLKRIMPAHELYGR